jgi:cell division protein DivIC
MTNRKKIKSRAIPKAIMFCAVACFAITLIRMQMEVIAKRRDLDSLEKAVAYQELINDETMRLLKTEDDREYIERVARDRFGFAYPDERIYYDRLGS